MKQTISIAAQLNPLVAVALAALQVNRAALSMILDAYETVTGKPGGREYLSQCLGAGSYIGAHMTSPVMVELKVLSPMTRVLIDEYFGFA